MTRKNKRCAPSARAADCGRLATRGEAQCQNAFAVLGCHAQVLPGNGECGDACKRQPDHPPEPIWTLPVSHVLLDGDRSIPFPRRRPTHAAARAPTSGCASLMRGFARRTRRWRTLDQRSVGRLWRPFTVVMGAVKRGPAVRSTVSLCEGVAFNAYRPHCPMRWTGERCVVVFFSIVGWTNTTGEVARQLEATAFAR